MIQEWQQGIVKIMTILGCTSLSDLRNKKTDTKHRHAKLYSSTKY
ncbi:hypothetical protein [Apilactobacillus ozensis]|nr:hypothetical protein [Apilactobacillus ozensis]